MCRLLGGADSGALVTVPAAVFNIVIQSMGRFSNRIEWSKGGNPMSERMRNDPFQEMTTLRDAMNQLLTESFVRPRGWSGASSVPLDLYETEDAYVAKLAVPGLKPDNF